MSTNPALLKADGMSRSLFNLTETEQEAFDRILRTMPWNFSSNDCRAQMDAAGIPRGRRGGMFNAAAKAGQIAAQYTSDGYPCRIPSTDPDTHGAYVQEYHRHNYSPRAVA